MILPVVACTVGRADGDDATDGLSVESNPTSSGTAGETGTSTMTDGADAGSAGSQDVADSADADSWEPAVRFDLGVIPDFELPPLTRCAKIDMLFVIDDSRSMSDEQMNMASSAPLFVQTMRAALGLRDVHIGVVATAPYSWNVPVCRDLGGLVSKTGGIGSSNAQCGPFAEAAHYMTIADDLDRAFPCAVLLGTGGDGDERPMAALQAALSPAMREPTACNAGFLRDDALLVIVIATDEEDDQRVENDELTGSPGDPASWYQAVVAAKGGRPESVVVLSLIGILPPNACPYTALPGQGIDEIGAEISLRIKEFTEMMGKRGIIGDVCAPSYGDFFEAAVDVVADACEKLKPAG